LCIVIIGITVQPIFAQQVPPIDLPIRKYENMDSVLEEIYDLHIQGQYFKSIMSARGLYDVNDKIRVEIVLEGNDFQLPNDREIISMSLLLMIKSMAAKCSKLLRTG